MAGAAVGAAAATWLGKRRLTSVPTRERMIEPESAELPLGRSADREIDESLSRTKLPQDRTSGATLLAAEQRFADESSTDASLDEVWNSLPGIAEGEQSEGYDAVSPEDLGAVWLERATQTTHEDRPHGSDPNELPALEDLLVSEATLSSSHQDGEVEDDEEDDDEIAEDELDER
jgi:hypothetical protein